MPKLVLPAVKYKKSFLKDFLKRDEMQDEYTLTGIPKREVPKKFLEFIKRLKLQAKGVYPRPGLVPQTVYWLVEGDKFLGKAGIRHRLNEHLKRIGGNIGYYIRPSQRGKGYGRLILKLALKKARSLGIKNALITCDISNLKSRKVIEANGGRFLGRSSQSKGLPDKLRFTIKT